MESIKYYFTGTFDQESTDMLISDPGYEFDRSEYLNKDGQWQLNYLLENVAVGEWHSGIIIDEKTHRNAELVALHENISKKNITSSSCSDNNDNNDNTTNQIVCDFIELVDDISWEKIDCSYFFGVCVDSGQAGIYDAKYFKDDNIVGDYKLAKFIPINDPGDKWYSMNCKITMNYKWHCVDTVPYGVVSSSGYGDGMYDLFVASKNDKIVAVKIVFIDDKQREKYEPLFANADKNNSTDSDDENNENESENNQ